MWNFLSRWADPSSPPQYTQHAPPQVDDDRSGTGSDHHPCTDVRAMIEPLPSPGAHGGDRRRAQTLRRVNPLDRKIRSRQDLDFLRSRLNIGLTFYDQRPRTPSM